MFKATPFFGWKKNLCSAAILFLGAGSVALAAPTLDLATQNFLQSPTSSKNETITVLLSYKNGALVGQGNSREALQRAMMASTERQEQKVLTRELNISSASKSTLWLLNGTAITLNRKQLQRASISNNLVSITSMNRGARLVRSTNAVSPKVESYTYGLSKINVPALRAQYPMADGRGVRVGIIDTGADANHNDLRGKIKIFKDFTSNNRRESYDDHGHGTHVAGTVAGGNSSGKNIGVAPAAELVIAKCFTKYGSSNDSELLSALQWMVDPDGNPGSEDNVNVISNSWELNDTDNKIDPANEPFCVAIENARKLGTVVVFAAGNSGPSAGTVNVPGSCPLAITVGATDEDDRIASFSSRGPSKWKSVTLVKPNISAPGVDIYSAQASGGYTYKSGTSMAAPHVAGALAVLFSMAPNFSIDDLQRALVNGATDLGNKGEDTTFGVGRADLLQSVQLLK